MAYSFNFPTPQFHAQGMTMSTPAPNMTPTGTLAPGQYNGMPMQRTAAQAYAPPVMQPHPMAMTNPNNNNFGLGIAPPIQYGHPGIQQPVQDTPPNILAHQTNNNGGGFFGQPQPIAYPIGGPGSIIGPMHFGPIIGPMPPGPMPPGTVIGQPQMPQGPIAGPGGPGGSFSLQTPLPQGPTTPLTGMAGLGQLTGLTK